MSCSRASTSLRMNLRRSTAVTTILLTMSFLPIIPAAAQTLTTLHSFTGGGDGAGPEAGVTMDAAGNLYGTTNTGGTNGLGVVFKLARRNSGWVVSPLHGFPSSQSDGLFPTAGITIGGDGSLYGTTFEGGNYTLGCVEYGCGIVFQLRPPASVCKTALCPWTETILHAFSGDGEDGNLPGNGSLVFDPSGNLYGTTIYGGGGSGQGSVYELSPSHGSWTETILHGFNRSPDGSVPYSGVIFDSSGNLYGTTIDEGNNGGSCGQSGCGVVYEITPSGGGWMENILYAFQNGGDGESPFGGLVFDQAGNLYGSTEVGGAYGAGTVFELTPSNGGWIFNTIYAFSTYGHNNVVGPLASLAVGSDGSLYGTTYSGGINGLGSVFRLTPVNGNWTYTLLHSFTGPDGEYCYGGVTLDASGHLYGPAYQGGAYGAGTVWEITP